MSNEKFQEFPIIFISGNILFQTGRSSKCHSSVYLSEEWNPCCLTVLWFILITTVSLKHELLFRCIPWTWDWSTLITLCWNMDIAISFQIFSLFANLCRNMPHNADLSWLLTEVLANHHNLCIWAGTSSLKNAVWGTENCRGTVMSSWPFPYWKVLPQDLLQSLEQSRTAYFTIYVFSPLMFSKLSKKQPHQGQHLSIQTAIRSSHRQVYWYKCLDWLS